MDPITAAGLIKASESEAGKSTVRLVERLLGPSADAIGQALGSYTERRLKNVDRIAKKAARKNPNATGSVNPRVAHRLLEEGSYVEDEVMAEYLAGVLAASKSDIGNDDRAVPITALVASMSADQIRAHFILYRTWVKRAAETGTPIALDTDRVKLTARIHAAEFLSRMGKMATVDNVGRIGPLLAGLARHDLVTENWAVGPREDPDPINWWATVATAPTPFGFELYAWGLGEPDFDLGTNPEDFAGQELDGTLPGAIAQAVFPRAD